MSKGPQISASPFGKATAPQELRFQYTGSYVDPRHFSFGSGDWISEDQCRKSVASLLRDPKVSSESIRIVVQHRKSRWLHLKNGSVSEIFPELQTAFEQEAAIKAILETPGLPVTVRLSAESAIKRGVPQALAEAKLLVAVLEKLNALLK